MRSAMLLLAVLAVAPSQAATLNDAKNRPVSKVITVLNDMLVQLQKEADEDAEVYETMGCWCETGDKEKTKAIAYAEATIAQLTAAIEEYTATSSRLNTEIANLEKEIDENTKAL